jgi:hypothetical protein
MEYVDTEGTLSLQTTSSATPGVSAVPVSVPVHLEVQNLRRVSVRMPNPGVLDKFGRPQ